jgi:RNA polymerase sigma-70 factor (ECF subfamily)
MESFDEVLTAAREGSATAFEALWRDLQPSLERYLRVAASSAAEDLASETWLQVARDIRGFRGDENDFRRWFFTIARHRVLDHARKQKRGRAEAVPPAAFAGIPDRDDPTGEFISTSAALELIATLPAAQAEAITLRVVAGLSGPDVARIMGKRPGAVRVLTSRGLRTLAERLSGAGWEAVAPGRPWRGT